MTTDRFTAWAMCPACERVDCHSLRAPKTFDATDPGQVAFEKIALMMAVVLGANQMTPSQEASFAVIRTCNHCNHEWGQL